MRVLFVPAARRGMGSGHLRRTGELAGRLGPEAALLLPGGGNGRGVEPGLGKGPVREREPRRGKEPGPAPEVLLQSLGFGRGRVRWVERFDPGDWDLVVLDRRATSRRELAAFDGVPVVGLDEGGEARRYAAYLVDILPTAPGLSAPNRSCPGLLFLRSSATARAVQSAATARGATAPPASPTSMPDRAASPAPPTSALASPDRAVRSAPPSRGAPRRILVSFGGEDPAGLTSRMLDALVSRLGVSRERLTVVEGPLFRRHEWPQGIAVLRSPERLADLLAGFDLVITSFGLTTFEALAAGSAVVNFNPSRYHRELSRAAGIPEVGVLRPKVTALRRLLNDPLALDLGSRYPQGSLRPPEDPAAFFRSLMADGPTDCPVCGAGENPAVARFERRSYFRCRSCGITYLVGFDLAARRYDGDYFGEEYRRQYGRTYLEDFESIKSAGRRRLQIIRRLLGRSFRAGSREPRSSARSNRGAPCAPGTGPPRLLDVGCAYGPFLAAAREAGYAGQGLDLSEAAVGYVQRSLGIPCRQGDFESAGEELWPAGSFEVLSLWYVIEHFRNPAVVLARAAGLLRPGGVLAVSTPNGAGISGRRDRTAFLRASPDDHRTVWNPRAARRILRRFGFRPRRVVVTGHHPERFPWFRTGSSAQGLSARTAVFRLLALASRICRLGDTFELYAVKREKR